MTGTIDRGKLFVASCLALLVTSLLLEYAPES
jgi:hypothetical protein